MEIGLRWNLAVNCRVIYEPRKISEVRLSRDGDSEPGRGVEGGGVSEKVELTALRWIILASRQDKNVARSGEKDGKPAEATGSHYQGPSVCDQLGKFAGDEQRCGKRSSPSGLSQGRRQI
ncbi:hypothetical protein DNTS_020537 [Danionella cerebrum]|uniref:Uncharacterized protein n=1 Tax=Danionella cerebrum TaxID=2873325 RepID=A0A553QA52_9TELE|nr:hypothetical protein DNTS_020537 [Danionella translucida]